MDDLERRYVPQGSAEMRVETPDEGQERIVHHAPAWDVLSQELWLEFTSVGVIPVKERFTRGAFSDVIDGDVVAIRDHDSSRVLGRTLSGTLRLEEDEIGLRYEVEPPDTSDGRDVVALINRGDLRGSSFSFRVAQGGDRWDYVDDELNVVSPSAATMVLRTVTKVRSLGDVGPVTFPAYPTEGLGLRSAQDAFKSWKDQGEEASGWKMWRRQKLMELGLHDLTS